MFHHFNWWYLVMPASLVLSGALGWRNCQTFDKGGIGRFMNAVLAVFGTVVICLLMFLESFRGAAQVTEWLMGPMTDGFDIVMVTITLILIVAIGYGGLLYWCGGYFADWRRHNIRRESRRVEYAKKAQAIDRATSRFAPIYLIDAGELARAMREAGWEIRPTTQP